MQPQKKILLIGSGRLATHLDYWNSLILQPNILLKWNRKDSVDKRNQLLAEADLVWLAISDNNLENFYEDALAQTSLPVVHFSGALHFKSMISAHPLMSFPKALFEKNIYSQIHFSLTGCSHLQAAMPGFHNSFSIMSPENKSLYHSMCVISGNFPQMLWNETEKSLSQMGIPDQAFQLYLKQITKNYLLLKEQSLTGPLVRGDSATIEKNLKALKDSPLQKIYQAFNDTFTKGPHHEN